jgi:DNA phosphorothioation system restriction enzyme
MFAVLEFRVDAPVLASLTQLPLKPSYRTGRDDLVRDFFVPCLSASILYRRAAGYFSSTGLALAARGVASLASRRGCMHLVVSPYLQPDDIAALEDAKDDPGRALRAIVARSLADIEDALIQDRLNALAWLAAAGLMRIRLALRLAPGGGYARGLFHAKTGIFSDAEGNHVSFSGSANETAGGLVENFEHIDAFRSWQDPEDRVQAAQDDFEALWENRATGLQVIDFSDSGRDLLDRYRIRDNPPPGLDADRIAEGDSPERAFGPPPGLTLRPYQKDAIRAWSRAGGRGILAMATGAGKTITALVLAGKVGERNRPLMLVVICPFINLCRQWLAEIAAFGAAAVPCFEGRQQWESRLDEAYQRLTAGLDPFQVSVTTVATFLSEPFQNRLRRRVDAGGVHHLLVADEVHHLGGKHARAALPDGIQLRLGLSATPERHLDPEGTAAVLGYFGDIVFEYNLAQAIADGRLCRYRYHPVPVELTDAEADEYLDLTNRLARFYRGAGEDQELNQAAMHLMMRRARLIGAAASKLVILDRIISDLPERPTAAIFYCGDGRTADPISQEERRQIKAVARLLGESHGLRVRNFTFRESSEEREEILRDLGSGFLDGVVAIRCLDEGIDIPELRMGFLLASSTNPRQFVQRRGRLLRNAPGKARAIIYDLFVTPPDLGGDVDEAAFNLERSFLQRELKRTIEFCHTAENGADALAALLPLRRKYNLLTLDP